MARIIDWKRSEDPRDAVHVAVQALVEGRLVVLPTETTYEVAASGLRPAAVGQLAQHVVGPSGIRPGLLVRSRDEAMDYVCDLSPVADRLARRSWPGPVALELRGDCPSGLVRQLSSEVRSVILDKGSQVNIRVAAHDAVSHILQLCPGPLISVPLLSSQATGQLVSDQQIANSGGNGDSGHNGYGPVTDQAAAHCESLDLLVLDDGPTHFKQLPSLVRVDGNHCNVLRNGAVDRQGLLSLGQMVILLVCTGNTCRSPMAQTLLCAKLKERFGDAATPSVTAISAGLSAASGGAASPEGLK